MQKKQSKWRSLVLRPGDRVKVTFDPTAYGPIHRLIDRHEEKISLDIDTRDLLLAVVGTKQWPELLPTTVEFTVRSSVPTLGWLAHTLSCAAISVDVVSQTASAVFSWLNIHVIFM
ncbi:MAG TPA: hypothetical protein VEB60_02905 [Candidatus Paceibacterota bacterium]|nr:hypothetical protein [Candidatus Paceibacterota bacterium]